MQAIRDIIDTEKLKHIMNIPENFGDKVEVIVLPALELDNNNIIEFEDKNENVKKIAGWSESDWQELVEENLMRDSTTTKDLF